MTNDFYFAVFALFIPLIVLSLIHFKVYKAFKKPKKASTIFEKMAQHQHEIKNPPLFKKFKKVFFKVLPYITGFLIKWFKFMLYFIPSYLLLKLFNL